MSICTSTQLSRHGGLAVGHEDEQKRYFHERRLYALQIETTDACQQGCIYCYAGSTPQETRGLTSDEIWGYVYRYHAFVLGSGGQWLDLGTLGGYESMGQALNDWNHAVGYTRDPQDHHVGFLWTWGGGMIDIGNLGGFYCDPMDIDNFDRIVGASEDSSGRHRPFLWENGVMIDLGTLGGAAGKAKGINDFGVVVGHAEDAGAAGLAGSLRLAFTPVAEVHPLAEICKLLYVPAVVVTVAELLDTDTLVKSAPSLVIV